MRPSAPAAPRPCTHRDVTAASAAHSPAAAPTAHRTAQLKTLLPNLLRAGDPRDRRCGRPGLADQARGARVAAGQVPQGARAPGPLFGRRRAATIAQHRARAGARAGARVPADVRRCVGPGRPLRAQDGGRGRDRRRGHSSGRGRRGAGMSAARRGEWGASESVGAPWGGCGWRV
jgi:hypothetical protein